MVLLLSLFLLISQAGDSQTSKMSGVDFSAVKQGKVEHDQGCLPLYSRQITFRIRNQSDKTIYIHGLKWESGHTPFGYLVRLDVEKNQWLNRQGETPHRTFKEFMSPGRVHYAPDVYVLRPGRSMTFKDLAEEIYLGSRVRRVNYVSFGRDEEPQVIMSEEFTLR